MTLMKSMPVLKHGQKYTYRTGRAGQEDVIWDKWKTGVAHVQTTKKGVLSVLSFPGTAEYGPSDWDARYNLFLCEDYYLQVKDEIVTIEPTVTLPTSEEVEAEATMRENAPYPNEKTVDWKDLASRAKTILLDQGVSFRYVTRYEDEFIKIEFLRGGGPKDGPTLQEGPTLEVTRKAMPNHPEPSLRKVSNPFYIEVGGECIRTHGEGIYVYDHIIKLSTYATPERTS